MKRATILSVALAISTATVSSQADPTVGGFGAQITGTQGRWLGKPIPGKKFHFTFGGCASCQDVDAAGGSNFFNIVAFLTNEATVAQASLAARDKELVALASSLWRAASKIAADHHTTYADPPMAQTREAQIAARLAYICSANGLTAECK